MRRAGVLRGSGLYLILTSPHLAERCPGYEPLYLHLLIFHSYTIAPDCHKSAGSTGVRVRTRDSQLYVRPNPFSREGAALFCHGSTPNCRLVFLLSVIFSRVGLLLVGVA
jgi:hypothetical protein